jgi:hypothetical protein
MSNGSVLAVTFLGKIEDSVKLRAIAGFCVLLIRASDENIGRAFGLVKGKPTERWRRKVSGLRSLGSTTAGPP